MRADGQEKIINRFGRTDDIIREVMNTFRIYAKECGDFAQQFLCDTEGETAKRIFDYVVANVRYREDPTGKQWIKTPARLLRDGVGDCKSMAIFTASMLVNLGIPCFFRFVSFSGGDVTHVYIVTNSGVIIDPVERVDGQPKFNYARRYKTKIDMAATTCISRLSGIGEIDTLSYGVDTDETPVLGNTLAANYLYSEIELQRTKLTINRNKADWGQLDFLLVALNLYQQTTGRPEMMIQSANVLQWMSDNGEFDNDSLDDEERGENIARLIAEADEKLYDFEEEYLQASVYDWFISEIMNQDYNNVTAGQMERMETAEGESEVGAMKSEQDMIFAKIQGSAPYFVYLWIDQKWVAANKTKYPNIFFRRQIEQNMFDSWVRGFKNFASANTIRTNLCTGFLKRYNMTYEQYVAKLMEEEKSGARVGVVTSATIGLITGIVTLIITIVAGIVDICQRMGVGNPDNYRNGYMTADDFKTSDYKANTSVISNSGSRPGNIVPLLAIGTAFLLLFKKNKKSDKNG